MPRQLLRFGLKPDDVDRLAAEGLVAEEDLLVPRFGGVVVEDGEPAFVEAEVREIERF